MVAAPQVPDLDRVANCDFKAKQSGIVAEKTRGIMNPLRKGVMPENDRSASFAADVIWTVAVVVAATVVIGGTKFVARKIRKLKKS